MQTLKDPATAVLLALSSVLACGDGADDSSHNRSIDSGPTTLEPTPSASEDPACVRALGLAAPPQLAPPEGCPSGEFREGICSPLRPIPPAPGECPGELDNGICLPAAVAFQDWSCPADWRTLPGLRDSSGAELPLGGAAPFTTCEPPVLEACAPGTFPVLGPAGCFPLDDACPTAAPWPEEASLRAAAPTFPGTLVYVAPQGALEANGSRANPFATVQAALDVAQPGDIVALGLGAYALVAPTIIPPGVAVVGACASGVQLAPELAGEDFFLLALPPGDTLLSDLSVGGARLGVSVEPGATATLQRLLVDGVVGTAVRARGVGTQLTLTEVAIVRTSPSSAGNDGIGFDVFDGARVEASRLTLVDNVGFVAFAVGAAVANVSDVIVTGTNSPLPRSGRAFVAFNGAQLGVTRAVLTGNRTAAVHATGVDTTVTVSDALIGQTTATEADNLAATGALSEASAQLNLERVTLQQNAGFAVQAATEASLEMNDVAVTETTFGRGEVAFDIGASSATVTGSRVSLLRSAGYGLFASASEVKLTDSVVLSSGEVPLGASAGTLTLDRAIVGEAPNNAIVLLSGARLVAQDTRLSSAGAIGLLLEDSSVELHRGAISNSGSNGISVLGTSQVVADDLAVTGTRSVGGNGAGITILTRGSAATRAEITRLLLKDNVGVSLAFAGRGTVVTLADAYVLDTAAQGGAGYSVFSGEGADLSLERALFSGNSGAASLAMDSGRVRLFDTTVQGTRSPSADLTGGVGILQMSGRLEGARVTLEGNVDFGLASGGADASLQLTDLLVTGTLPPEPPATSGFAILLSQGTAATIDRAAIVGNVTRSAIEVGGSAQLFLTDAVIADTLERDERDAESDGGAGLFMVDGSQVELRRVSLRDNHEFGVSAFGEGTVLTLADTSISGTKTAECRRADCPAALGGSGLALTSGARADLQSFEISNNALAGLQLSLGGTVHARDGVIAANLIGVNTVEAQVDAAKDFDGVRLQCNQVDVDIRELPVPIPPDLSTLGLGL